MLRYNLGFLLIVIISAIVAFSNVAPAYSFAAKIIFYCFLALLVISSSLTAFAAKKHSNEGKQTRSKI